MVMRARPVSGFSGQGGFEEDSSCSSMPSLELVRLSSLRGKRFDGSVGVSAPHLIWLPLFWERRTVGEEQA